MSITRAPAEQVQAVTNQIRQLFEQRRQIMQRAADEAAAVDQQLDNGLAWAVQNAGGDELVALSILGAEQAAINDALGAGMASRLKALDDQVALYGNALMLETGMTTFKAHGKTARRELKTKFSATRAELDAFIAANPQWLSLYTSTVSKTALSEYADAVTEQYLSENPGKTAADVPADLLLPPGVKAFSEFTFTIKAK